MNSRNKNSVLYLALLCLLYFFITSNYLPSSNLENSIYENEGIFIEISEDGTSTVKTLTNPDELKVLQSRYNLSENLSSGDRIIINQDDVIVTKISAIKRISLGVPIGINSATMEDLQAIPGIGEELGIRIINFRENIGEFQNLDELDSIDGIGSKKLGSIKKVMYVD